MKTEFISAIFAALLLASALVGQFCKIDGKIIGEKMQYEKNKQNYFRHNHYWSSTKTCAIEDGDNFLRFIRLPPETNFNFIN